MEFNPFPRSMEYLPVPVREKAIQIANALLDEGMDEGKAIRTAIVKAKEWARSHLDYREDVLGIAVGLGR